MNTMKPHLFDVEDGPIGPAMTLLLKTVREFHAGRRKKQAASCLKFPLRCVWQSRNFFHAEKPDFDVGFGRGEQTAFSGIFERLIRHTLHLSILEH